MGSGSWSGSIAPATRTPCGPPAPTWWFPISPSSGSLPSRRTFETSRRRSNAADEIRTLLSGRRVAVFLDYDGTLTPIVERPEDALLPAETRAAIERLAALAPVAIVSGRDLADVRRLIGIEGITYAGSHGFDVVLPDGSAHQRGTEFLPALDAAERDLRARLASVPGAQDRAEDVRDRRARPPGA